jgi:dihydroxy-acid dehydratase
MGRETPVLVDLKPSGQHYMEALPRRRRHGDAAARAEAAAAPGCADGHRPHAGRGTGARQPPFKQDVVRPRDNPIYPQGGIAVLQGNLAPGGAIIKQSAADPKLMEHEGRAVVFERPGGPGRAHRQRRPRRAADDVLVLKNIGPKGAPGMPEAGYIPLPRKLARQGVKDMVRISDGRMSGTAFGTIVLHVTPESAIGGPLAMSFYPCCFFATWSRTWIG